jgi:hypothetical protein
MISPCRLGLGAAQEKLDGVAHPLREFVRSRQIHGPLPDHGVEEPLHELGEMNDRKILRDLAIFLALGDNFAEKADGGCLGSPQLWRAYWIHRASENYGLPERPPHLRGVSQSFVKPPEPLFRGGFGGQLGLETLGLASKGPAPDFAQYRKNVGWLISRVCTISSMRVFS